LAKENRAMQGDRSDERARAEQLLQEQRYGEAIEGFSEHLRRAPDDPEALLQLGICHLLNRSEKEFLAIHERASRVLDATPVLPGAVSRLWTLYRSLVAKLTATALAVGAVAACERSGAQSPEVNPEPTQASTVATGVPTAAEAGTLTEPSATSPTAPESPPPATPTALPTAPAKPSATAAVAPSSKPTESPVVAPAHRYSGGVRPPSTKPAHRYSGGVF
jgi:hypothetical protein